MLVVFSGPSGAGKSYAVDTLEADMGMLRVVPWTSRQPRLGERPGIDYNFASVDEILASSQALDSGYWVQALGDGNLFGYTTAIDEAAISPSLHVAQAAASIATKLKAKHPKHSVLALFLDFETQAAFERKLAERIRSPDERAKRRDLAAKERVLAVHFDFQIRSDNPAETVQTARRLVGDWWANRSIREER